MFRGEKGLSGRFGAGNGDAANGHPFPSECVGVNCGRNSDTLKVNSSFRIQKAGSLSKHSWSIARFHDIRRVWVACVCECVYEWKRTRAHTYIQAS